MGKPTRRWLRMLDIYRRFSVAVNCQLDWSDAALTAMFEHESNGAPEPPPLNGPLVGKRWMDVHIAMWREDIAAGLLDARELRNDFPAWWIDRVLA